MMNIAAAVVAVAPAKISVAKIDKKGLILKLNTTENLSEGDRRAIVEHFAEQVVNTTLQSTNGDFRLAKSIFFKAAAYIQKQIKEMENEDLN